MPSIDTDPFLSSLRPLTSVNRGDGHAFSGEEPVVVSVQPL